MGTLTPSHLPETLSVQSPEQKNFPSEFRKADISEIIPTDAIPDEELGNRLEALGVDILKKREVAEFCYTSMGLPGLHKLGDNYHLPLPIVSDSN